ncbi:MAG: homoserine kinase [Deltaproteobacteria bacterium]|nr:homoserine kinase [Deltaproteobacteria bacterium]
MGTFTVLDDADVAAIAQIFGLGPVTAWRAIAAGTINSNFAVTAGGARWFIRVNEGKSVEDVGWEAALCRHLAAGAPVAVPRLTLAGDPFATHRGLLVSAFGWLPGVHRDPGQVTVDDARGTGAALARIHLAGADFTPHRDGIYTPAHIAARFAGFRDRPDPALAEAIAILGDELAGLDAAAPIRAAAPRGIIHGDLFRDNVLFADGAVAAVLDFEQASWGSLAYDLAVAINDWAWDGAVRVEIVRALLEGYDRVRPIDVPMWQALPIEVRGAAARFTVTRITDVYLPGIANPDKDFRDYLARLVAWRTGDLGRVLDAV